MNSDVAIILGEDEKFRRLQPLDFARKMSQELVIDTRRVLDAEKFRNHVGITYVALGVHHVTSSKKKDDGNLHSTAFLIPESALHEISH
jgi:hypothetical protein